ncbi:MAG: hypothetical protein WCT04_09425 [Planctomycetota bacterium]
MNDKSDRFYKDFDYFMSELLQERGRCKTLSGDWVAASTDMLGTGKMKALIPALAVFGAALLPAFSLVGGLVAAGIASQTYKALLRNKASVLARLEKAKHLFQTLSQLVERGNADAKEEIDRLFNDLVMDRDFIS